MFITPKSVTYYVSPERRVPYKEWYDSLEDKKTRFIITNRLARVRRGLLGDCKNLGDGIWELRIDYGPGLRIYLGQQGYTIMILLCGGDKSTQRQDIEKAKEYWAHYQGGIR